MHITYNYEYPVRLKAGFIGCGGHAFRNVYPTFQYAPVDLVAVCDIFAAKSAAIAKCFGATRTYTDHHEMLAKEQLDVVFIVTNYDDEGRPRYPKLAIDCMRAGAHAWIEKPPASSTAEVQEMIRVSKETGRYVGVGLKKMFFPSLQKAKDIMSQPAFGRITSITARYPQYLPPFEDRHKPKHMVGFLDHMVHPHSVLKYICGDIDWLFVNRSEVNGATHVSMRFKNGAIGNLYFSNGQSNISYLEQTEIIGEGENIVIENNVRIRYYRKNKFPDYGREGSFFESDQNAALFWEPEFSLGQLHNKGMFLLGYAPEIIYFTTRLLENKAPEIGTLEDALEMLRIYEAYQKPDFQKSTVG